MSTWETEVSVSSWAAVGLGLTVMASVVTAELRA